MTEDVALERLRRVNPVPDPTATLQIERVLQRLDDEPPDLGPRGLRERQGWSRALGRSGLAAAVALVAAVVLVFATLRGHGTTPHTGRPAFAPPVPATYAQACAQTSDCATVPPGPVPAALRTPFPLPRLRPGRACPTTAGQRFSNSYIGGTSLGTVPVRPDIANPVEFPYGRIALGTTDARGWFGIKTVWFSRPSYSGPWSVRAVRLSGQGQIDLRDEPTSRPSGAGSPFSSTAIVIPPGDTLNTGFEGSGAGYRTDPRTTWISAPGCYAWKVNGIGFNQLIVFQALPPHSK